MLVLLVAASGAALAQQSLPVAETPVYPPEPGVSSAILPGAGEPAAPAPPVAAAPASGDVRLNFPGVDVQLVARAVLGGILRLPYSVDPSLHTPVTVVTDRPIARGAVLPYLEGAFRAAGLALVNTGGTYVVAPVDQAQSQAQVLGQGSGGYGSEVFPLKFVSAAELRRLIEPVLPGLVAEANAGGNTLTVTGTSGQRNAVRDLVRQFDVNWLRNMSFALFVPQRTDGRLIVPELDKLINAPGAPTNGLVRLIAMERLNGILAVSPQPQYLEDVRRWIEILDREGQNNEPRLFVYRVQNGRSADLARTLVRAFGGRQGNAQQQQGFAAPPFSDIRERNGSAAAATSATDGAGDQQAGSTPSGSPLDRQAAVTSDASPSSAADGETNGSQQRGQAGVSETVSLGATGRSMTISSDEANNAIVVFAAPREYAIIEDALRKLDLPPLQVLIEVAITEVSLNKELRYGVQWLFRDGNDEAALSQGGTKSPTRLFPGLSLVYSNSNSITATLNALEGLTNINVVSAPKLMVLNNQTATLQVGDQVPIATASAVSTENPDSPIVNQIEYKDTGVLLKLTPRVNAGGLVLIDINQEVSDVSQTSTSSIDSPTISTRRLASSIAVQDGNTIALGGLIRAARTRGNSGIPLLSRIPVLGALFGTKTNNERRTELLILLRPRVVRTPDDGRAITEELRQKIQSLAPGTRGADLP
jgi:general secretion pathway protein D